MLTLDKTMSASSLDFFGGSLSVFGSQIRGGSSFPSTRRFNGEDLTLKFLQIRVARWCYCQIFFVVPYSYPNCKVLYEERLISSHIFIPGHPLLLDPSFTSRGKDKSWTRCGGFRQLLGGRSKKIVQLKHSFSPNIFELYYWHSLSETFATSKKRFQHR